MNQTCMFSKRLLLLLTLWSVPMYAQYWQQFVEYEMDIILDTENHTLTATSDLLYVNHSPDTLDQVLMHLYHNAFNEGTIAHQVWSASGYAFDEKKGWSGISVHEAVSDSNAMAFTIRDDTILDITLNRVLSPGDTLKFNLDWSSNIHPHLDRSGYEGQQYDFAQWYPKFVVYDENGWHDDPFGDWGEFYGEFGNFTVHLDVPATQVVGATGVVVDGDPGWSEVTVDTSVVWDKWVEEFNGTRESYLADLDSTSRREVTFFAENVHDFAWLCSPDFVYEHGNWNGIDIHSLFPVKVGKTWTKDVVKHGVSAIRWLSEKFGPYPWPQMTITKALLGGGMEYPMLIMDATDSESLIVHEIGHNWFFGLFGNDELDDAWMDEGFTSFQTDWYLEHYYPDNGYAITRKSITPFESEKLPRQLFIEKELKSTIRYMTSPLNEPLASHSQDFVNTGSYRTNVYDKASIMLQTLKGYLGEERFLAGMTLYYDRWALKHVNEDRFIKAMEDATGEELDWFFDQWLHTRKYIDYALDGWKVAKSNAGQYTTTIRVENKGGLFLPIPATVFGKDGETATAKLKEFRYRSKGVIEVESDFEPVSVYLDAENNFLDVDRRNNSSKRNHSWRYNYKGWNQYPADGNLYLWKPQFGFNDNEGLGLGLRVDRVYRNPGNFVALELDHNILSQELDYAVSFSRKHLGLPFEATWSGELGSWHSMKFASFEYELHWAKRFWRNPIHYLTIKTDYTDAGNTSVTPVADQYSFTQMSLQYELQHKLLGGNYGMSAMLSFSPSALGNYGNDFSQFSIMDNWTRTISRFIFNNRSNFMSNSQQTPDLVKTRVATRNLRNTYLDRTASSLHHISGFDMVGPHLYLAGGTRSRAYTDSLDRLVSYAWSNNMDIMLRYKKLDANGVSFSAFFDLGQTSADAENWTWIGDVGFGLQYSPIWERTNWLTTLLRPVNIKFELPLVRIEQEEWVSTQGKNLWIFSISN